jgi:small subunit ribosomal protein S1
VDLPEQVVTPGEELWVKIIDLDLQRRRISLSIKQAAEGGVVAAEYQEHFGEHAYDDEGNYIGPTSDGEPEQAWPEYLEGTAAPEAGSAPDAGAQAEAGAAGGADGPAEATEAPGETAGEPGPEASEPSDEPPSSS